MTISIACILLIDPALLATGIQTPAPCGRSCCMTVPLGKAVRFCAYIQSRLPIRISAVTCTAASALMARWYLLTLTTADAGRSCCSPLIKGVFWNNNEDRVCRKRFCSRPDGILCRFEAEWTMRSTVLTAYFSLVKIRCLPLITCNPIHLCRGSAANSDRIHGP